MGRPMVIYRIIQWMRDAATGQLRPVDRGSTRDAARARRMASSAPISTRVLDLSAWGDDRK